MSRTAWSRQAMALTKIQFSSAEILWQAFTASRFQWWPSFLSSVTEKHVNVRPLTGKHLDFLFQSDGQICRYFRNPLHHSSPRQTNVGKSLSLLGTHEFCSFQHLFFNARTAGIHLWCWCYFISNQVAGFYCCITNLLALGEIGLLFPKTHQCFIYLFFFSVALARCHIFGHGESHCRTAYYTCWLHIKHTRFRFSSGNRYEVVHFSWKTLRSASTFLPY